VAFDAAHCRGRSLLLGRDAQACTDAVVTDGQRAVDAMIARLVLRHSGMQAFFPTEVLCQGGRCPMIADGHILSRDGLHLSPAGAKLVGAAIQARLKGALLH
jgi:lysophospholipase L1-like esterase